MPGPDGKWTKEDIEALIAAGEAPSADSGWTREKVKALVQEGTPPEKPQRSFSNPLGITPPAPITDPSHGQQALNFLLSGLGAHYPGMEQNFGASLGGGFALGGGNILRSGLQGTGRGAAGAVERFASQLPAQPVESAGGLAVTGPRTAEEITARISQAMGRPAGGGLTTEILPPVTGEARAGQQVLGSVLPPPVGDSRPGVLQRLVGEVVPGLRPRTALDTTTPVLDAAGNVVQAVRDPVVDKIAQGLAQATRVRLSTGELALARAEDISKKVAIASAREAGASGTEKIGAIKSGLFGEAPVAGHFAPPTDLELTGADVSHVIDDIIFKNPTLRTLDRLEAYRALEKVALGDVPTNSEIDMLGKVLGLDIAQDLRRLRGFGAKTREAVLDSLNLSKAIRSAYDFSAPLRQGLFLVGRHPLEAGRQFKNMLQHWASEKGSLELQSIITQDPLYEEIRGVRPKALTAIAGTNPADREEAFAVVTDLAHNWLPGLRMSERAYAGFLNGMRFGVIKNAVRNAEAAGKNIGDIVLQRALADFAKAGKTLSPSQQETLLGAARREELGKLVDAVMSLSGRGPSIPGIAPEALNIGFWSPRLITSRFSVLIHTGQALGEYATAGVLKLQGKEAHIRLASKEVAQDVAATVGIGMSILGLIKATGLGSVELDPRSPDFGKVRIGKTRYDFWGGFQQIARYTAQLVSGQSKTVGTDIVSDANQVDTLARFLRSKLSPLPGAVVDTLAGKTFTGDPASPNRVAWNLFVPLFIADIRDAVVEDGVRAGFLTVPSAFGVSAQTFNTKEDMTQLFAPGRRYKEIANPALKRQIDTAWSLYRLSESEVQDVKEGRLRTRLLRRMNRGQSIETQQANRTKVQEFLENRRSQGNESGP